MGVYIPPFPPAPRLPNLAPPCPPRPTDGGPHRPSSPLSTGRPPTSPAKRTGPIRSLSGSRSCLAPGWRRSARAGGLDLAVGASPSGVLSEPLNFFVLGFGLTC